MIKTLMIRPTLLMAVLALAPPAFAQSEPRLLDTHRDWRSYVLEGNAGKICYIASDPSESSPAMEGRSATWVLVTHRPADNVRNEVGVVAGYVYQSGTRVNIIIDIDTDTYQMFTQADGAWLRTPEEDVTVVEAMKKGRRMTVVGYSSTGITTTDKYSLLGFTAAHRAISKECE